MFRGVKSLVRAVDRFVRLPPSTARLKQPLNSIFGHSIFNSGNNAGNNTRNFATHHIPSFSHHAPIHVKANLSLPARVALGRPLTTPFLPRPPTVPRSITQVGLGTARNFSTSRPIFQNIVDNVPIATRAFWEADWDIKQGEGQNKRLISRKKQTSKTKKIADKAKQTVAPSSAFVPTADSVLSASIITTADVSRYFATPFESNENVTTYLDVPLAPAREPLPQPILNSSVSGDLLPRLQFHTLQSAYERHSIKVASLFRRLDVADVWSKGVECECYGDGLAIGSNQAPGHLRLVFRGWTREQVDELIGEAVKGWCTAETVINDPAQTGAEAFLDSLFHPSPTLTPLLSDNFPLHMEESEFVLPTLDFSSSFLAQSEINTNWRDVQQLEMNGLRSGYASASEVETSSWGESDDEWHAYDTTSEWSHA